MAPIELFDISSIVKTKDSITVEADKKDDESLFANSSRNYYYELSNLDRNKL